MPIILSSALVLSLAQTEEVDLDNPVIGWQNFITPNGVRSGTELDIDTSVDETGFPAANVANPATNLKWVANTSTGDVNLQMILDSDEDIDYLAIAGHNLGDNSRQLQVFGSTEVDSDGNPIYTEITDQKIVADNTPIIFRFEPAKYIFMRLAMVDTLSGGGEAPIIATLYCGKLLVLERKIQVSFTPINYGRQTNILNGRSENGNFLGRVVTSQWVQTAANLAFLTPDWYRDNMEPFIKNAETEPFFFAWAPTEYPNEVGYCWLTDDAVPVITHPHRFGEEYMAITLSMQGIVDTIAD